LVTSISDFGLLRKSDFGWFFCHVVSYLFYLFSSLAPKYFILIPRLYCPYWIVDGQDYWHYGEQPSTTNSRRGMGVAQSGHPALVRERGQAFGNLRRSYRYHERRAWFLSKVSTSDLMPLRYMHIELNASKAQYETRLKKWGFRKYSKKADWTQISNEIDSRKLRGKETEVFIGGEQVQPNRIRKQMRRHQKQKAGHPYSQSMYSPGP
jgi:hypothetical protein